MSAEKLIPAHLRLLLIEDREDDAILLKRHLQRNGFSFDLTRVETAVQMQDALSSGPPDVILADYNLPQFSGPAALQLLKNTGLDIPFIMMSGAISEETAVQSMRAGAQDYVTKQNLARLVPALERELREASARRHKLAAETALRASEARFHRLVAAMPLGLLITNSSGGILYANAAVERLLGYPNGQLLSGAIKVDTICAALRHALDLEPQELPTEPFETACTTATGATVEVLIGVALLNPDSETDDRQTAAFMADLTLQKKSEELLRRSEKLAVTGRLAASIAHEINNPLEAITNCLYLVGQAELSHDARTYLELAQKELDRVAQITVQTLRFYRRSTHMAETDIKELVETVFALLESRLQRQNIRLVRDFAPVPKILMHDGEIRQVLANLIGNAVDAVPTGGSIVLRTRVAREWGSGRQGLRITVADTGSGMDNATLSRIFEPFFSTKGITGTGLGLWVSREIIDKHQGTIRVRSRKHQESRGGGTVFALFIPQLSSSSSPGSSEQHTARLQ